MGRLGLRFLVLGCVVASGASTVYAQCTEGIYTQQGACNQGIQARWVIPGNLSNLAMSVDFRGIYDPARNMTVGPSAWTNIQFTSYPNFQSASGDCLKMWFTGNLAPNAMGATVGTGGFGWPTASLQAYPTGRFELRFGYQYPAGTWHYLYFKVYKTSGTFHCEAPSPVIDPPATEDDPDVQNGKIVIRPYVYQAGDPQEDVNVYLRGAKKSDGITGSDGSVRFVDTGTGEFQVIVNGTSETGKKLYAELYFKVESVRVYRPKFYFDSNGNIVDFGLAGDEGGGWDILSTILQALFVPSDEAVTSLWRNMDEFFSWGPLVYLVAIKDMIASDPPGGMTLQDYLKMAPLQWDKETMRWSRGTSNPVTIVNLDFVDDEQNNGGWVIWIRWALAMIVYISFGIIVVKIFTPVHVV